MRRRITAAGVAAACLFGGCAAAGAAKSVSPSAVVVGVVGESGGVNVLHADFRTADGRTPAYPSGMPRPVMIALPHIASFASSRAALERGPLGHLKPGVLYGVAGTRLLVVNAGSGPYDAAQADAVHATGVADALTGTRYGTDPNALVVVVLTNGNELASYHWLAQQSWVDIASTSDYEISTTADPTQCAGAADVRAWTAAGHQLFSSAGNTTDQPEPLVSPNGLPETYVVGGVTAQGKTWTPGQTTETDPFYEFGNVVRPYETGELYSFKAAAPDSPTGTQHFGGTSGATPRTAGWAATLIAHARAALRQTGPVRGALAAGPHRPLRGPLRDGRFTRTELTTLLHEVAMPHSGLPDGAQYAAEGFGALNASAIARAMRILDGTVSQPTRPGDEQADALAHQARAVLLDRC